jgi:hypothetical protein
MGIAEFEKEKNNALGASLFDPLDQINTSIDEGIVFAWAGDPANQTVG